MNNIFIQLRKQTGEQQHTEAGKHQSFHHNGWFVRTNVAKNRMQASLKRQVKPQRHQQPGFVMKAQSLFTPDV